jgi:hypothetical protein
MVNLLYNELKLFIYAKANAWGLEPHGIETFHIIFQVMTFPKNIHSQS